MISKQYQVRIPPDIEGDMKKVWLSSCNTTENLLRIIRTGVNALMVKKTGGNRGTN